MNNTNIETYYAQVQAFKSDLRNLISTERLMSYDNSIAKHDASLELNAKLTPKIAQAEIYLRNIVDFCMQLTTHNSSWIVDETYLAREIDKIYRRVHKDKTIKEHIDTIQITDPRAYNSYLLSNLTLGSIIVVIKQNHLQNLIFDFRKQRLDFRSFCSLNKRIDLKLPNYHKVNIVLDLFSSLRNACFHWENLAKTRTKEGVVYPRLSACAPSGVANHSERIISLAQDRIEYFLEFLLKHLKNT
ncbi:CAAX protease [Helicobacter bizzozeronii]|uniref:hypothetical protein n=1 Tax=Helicobacter bizzozeronii TaxID=56877 RepID=UPI00244D927C|nr:hypothetical protein [Helicobacter bizzozeronii]GMB93529.1 CAAX protease [Helicobacter bizzozeronii]